MFDLEVWIALIPGQVGPRVHPGSTGGAGWKSKIGSLGAPTIFISRVVNGFFTPLIGGSNPGYTNFFSGHLTGWNNSTVLLVEAHLVTTLHVFCLTSKKDGCNATNPLFKTYFGETFRVFFGNLSLGYKFPFPGSQQLEGLGWMVSATGDLWKNASKHPVPNLQGGP